jgi:ribosomal protein S18 acetylase RimI-like enzyme
MDKVKANIENLTSLWKTASEHFQTYYEGDGFAHSSIPDSQWPNRVWTTQKDLKVPLANIIEIMDKNGLVLSYFDLPTSNNRKEIALMEDKGLSEKGVQHGMAIQLDQSFDKPTRLSFQMIKNAAEVKPWCNAFKQSFGYEISEETLYTTYQKIDYFNVYYQNKVIGTIILYITNGVAGIHSLGIIPEMRGKGFAREAMHFILNLAIEKEATVATLQASGMAKSMYESLGFYTQFIMRNYQFKDK